LLDEAKNADCGLLYRAGRGKSQKSSHSGKPATKLYMPLRSTVTLL
jgi:hypothetical protein